MCNTTKPIEDNKLSALRRFWRCNRRMPTYSEMCRIFGYGSKNAAFRFVKKLMDEGYVEKDTAGRLTPKGDRLGIPLVGYVQAGFPSPAEEELIDTLSIDEYLVDKPEASFLLKVTGDSMIEAGIHEGDLVIIERGGSPKFGDIVLACVDGEWTLKYYHKGASGVELVPANPKYPVIRPEKELTLGGIVRAVMRRY
jgi:repressor LexA